MFVEYECIDDKIKNIFMPADVTNDLVEGAVFDMNFYVSQSAEMEPSYITYVYIF